MTDLNTCSACDPERIVMYGICPECFKEGQPALIDFGIQHAPEYKYNSLLELLKNLLLRKTEVIPNESVELVEEGLKSVD